MKAVVAEVGLSVRTIMREKLNWRKVPLSLQPQQEACRMAHCTDHLQLYAREGNEWWLEVSLGVITSNQNRNDKVSSERIQGHHHQQNPRSSTQVQESLC